MQPWDQVQVTDANDPRNGTAGLVIATKGAGEEKQLTVKMDSDGASVAYKEAQLKLLGR
ncbi:hypothetical protein [Ralstonia holmesii]|uniref:hypothetical protein n=1 Tax=Ralstonia holmesii TaxID=3058602 RepID=UPI003D64FC93